MMLDLFDVVRVKTALPEQGLDAGAIGAVVAILRDPDLRYEIEVVDEDGRTRFLGPIAPDDLERC
ncbi:DUF4926 domain-containing protein [Actinokineospora cianjurensis]|uniref:Uncharacterized protein DUF4926 n=1 Tax=Actinokineospora cianjurensis TaxID=585224 RepID=A0A421B375_9PSEU|nr:DUF4926 domain-containing protein [Actinokineospora cianjurensis]RLK58740.1 uncharacterized protein DUF4926 [Actinokineospora cianjurensis]